MYDSNIVDALGQSSGHIYTSHFDDATFGVTQLDVFQIVAGAKPVVIHRIQIDQRLDTAAILDVFLMHSDGTVVGSGGAANTPEPHKIGGLAAVSTVTTGNTTVATVVTTIQGYLWDIDVEKGFIYEPKRRQRIIVPALGSFVVRISANATEMDVMANMVFEEVNK